MARRTALAALLLLLAGCLLAASQVAAKVAADEPDGMAMDENNQHFIMAHGVKYYVYRDGESNKIFYVNTETRDPQWNDPREILSSAEHTLATVTAKAGGTLTVAAVTVVPMLLFIAGLAGRIYYLHTYYPELLFPTKERKDRQRTSGGKFKAQKARGKMNQDGKGGRSANS